MNDVRVTRLDLSGYVRGKKYHSLHSFPKGISLEESVDIEDGFTRAFKAPHTVTVTLTDEPE